MVIVEIVKTIAIPLAKMQQHFKIKVKNKFNFFNQFIFKYHATGITLDGNS